MAYRSLSIVDTPVAEPAYANCKYSRPGADPKFSEHWVCTAEEGEIIRPAGMDSVTGEIYLELRKSVRCLFKNFNEDCTDFEQKSSQMVLTEPHRGLLRTGMLKLGAWLIAKGS